MYDLKIFGGRIVDGTGNHFFKANIGVFDLEKIADKATEEEPYLYPEGIDYVIVNGEVTVQKGEHTGVLAGQILRHDFSEGGL